jgi:GDPmannose 4,6-dehydratase
MKTAVITGISGQDGIYLSKFLLDKGYKVIGIIRSYRLLNFTNFIYLGINPSNIIFEELDLMDMANIIRFLKKYKPNEIYNLAAQSSVSQSFDQSIGTFSFNTYSVNNLLESIKLINSEIKLYQASSSEMFGRVKSLPIKLSTPMSPISPYGISKMASFFMVKTYRESYNIFASNGILFNHESPFRAKNFFTKKIINGAIAIKDGKQKFLEVGNLQIKRDFGYAKNYVEAMWKLLQQEKPKDIIICSGESIMLRDVVEYVFKKLEIDKSLIIEKKEFYRPNEIFDIYGDNSEAKKTLNWDYNLSFFKVLDILIDYEINNRAR